MSSVSWGSGLGASALLPARTSAERNSCFHPVLTGSRGNVVCGLAEKGHSSCATRGHFQGGGAQSSGAFVITVSSHFSGATLSLSILSYCCFWDVWRGQAKAAGNTVVVRSGETGSSSVRKAALWGGQHGLGGLGSESAGAGSERSRAAYTGKVQSWWVGGSGSLSG